MEVFAQWLVVFVQEVGYPGIFLAMCLGNMLVPVPVEVIMIPAGYLLQQHQMHLVRILACAIGGDVTGSLLAFWFAFHFGRRVLTTYGKYVFFGEDKVAMLDGFFASHGEISTLTGRLVPGLRHFMAFPAGLSHMNMEKFALYTGVGGGLWSAILVLVGYMIGDNKALVRHYMPYIEGAVIGAVILMVVLYIKRHHSKKQEA